MAQLSTQELKRYLEIAVSAAKEGGKILLKHWGKLNQIHDKAIQGDLVTEADKESEKVIISYLEQACPTHSILSEEVGMLIKDREFCWVVDPLDGTTNYAHQFPASSVSIALLFQDTPVLGVVYNPMREEMFQAAQGLGTTLNGSKIYVSKVNSLQNSLLVSGFPYDRRDNPDNNYAEFCFLTNQTQGVRRMGSAALDLAYVAAGRFDGYWERGIKPWDIAAGIVLVQEAGGKVSDYNLKSVDVKTDRILATNGLIHDTVSQELLKAKNNAFVQIA